MRHFGHPLTRNKDIIPRSVLCLSTIYLFYKGFKGTFVDSFNHLANHLDTLWYWLMLLHVGHTCGCSLQAAFSTPVAQINKLRAHHHDYLIR